MLMKHSQTSAPHFVAALVARLGWLCHIVLSKKNWIGNELQVVPVDKYDVTVELVA